ncbi:hypothetical protein J4Q44_G00221080 [Coregonus suidteri]|uniref:Calcipressin-3 n=1 Tax=Coregonus suidteri TaxID=861788 RepID=A0AAN8LBS9_9TELE
MNEAPVEFHLLPPSGSPLFLCSLPLCPWTWVAMLREGAKAWINVSEAYSSDPEEEEEEDMVCGEDEDGEEEMMDLSDLPTALFACSVHEAVFEEDRHRVRH